METQKVSTPIGVEPACRITLKASIASHGLLENLIARSMEPGTDGIARYAVIAGGRRLAAMQALATEGALEEDHLVPCRTIGAIVAAEEVSLAENSVPKPQRGSTVSQGLFPNERFRYDGGEDIYIPSPRPPPPRLRPRGRSAGLRPAPGRAAGCRRCG